MLDKQAVDACFNFANDHRFLVELASGASLSVVYEQNEAIKKAENIVVIVCGSIGVDLEKFQKWKNSF